MARTFQGHEPLGSASDFSDSFARYGFGPGSPVTDEFATITLNPVHTRDESTDATHALLGPNVPSDSPSRRPINKNPQPKSRFSDPSARASRGNSLPSPARSNSKGVAFAFRPQNALQGFRDLGRRLFNWGHRRPFFVFLIISSCLASTAMTAYSTYNWAWGRLSGDVSSFIPHNATGIVLLASITSINLDSLTADITWLPYGCGPDYAMPLQIERYSHFPLRNAGEGCGRLMRPVQIQVNGAEPYLFDPSTPDFRYRNVGSRNGYGAPDFPGVRTWIPAFDTFNTTEAIVPQFAISQNWNSLAYYPFDGYRILMRVWATAPSGDVNLLGAPLPVIKVFSVDSPTGLPVQSGSWDVEDDSGDMVATEVIFKISRHDVVKAFAMIIFFVNWGLMLVMVWILILVATDRSRTIPREILLLPITAILAIPQLRATMPGVPHDFGLLMDIPGYFFTMTIIIITAALTVLLMMNQTAKRPRPSMRITVREPESPESHDEA